MYEALLKSTAEYQKIAESLHTPGPAALFGLPPAGRALLYAALQKDLDRVLCIVTPGEAEATHFADDLKALGLTAAVFPPRDFMLRPVEGAGREYEYRRLSVLGALAGGRLNAVCVPAEALLQYTVPRDEFLRNTLTLKPGMVYNREALVARLFAAGYVRRSQVDGPGQFSVRGDIVDIYAPDMHQPARVEYWDDEIDSLASFDLLTQRRDGSLEKIYLSPAREVLFGSTAETAEALRGAIKKARGKKRTAMEKATEADLAQLDSGLMPEAMDKYYGIRYPQPATLLDHLDSPIFVLDEVGGIRDAQKATEDFMYWCVTSDTATSIIADKMGLTAPFKSAKETTNVFSQQAVAMAKDGKKTVAWDFVYIPSEEWKKNLKQALIAYAADNTKWDGVKNAFVDGWKTEKAASE